MSDFAALVEQVGQLCRAIASRDLAGQELYIIRQSTISAEYGTAEGCEAYTSPCLDLYLREFMPNWRGRGPCLVLNDLALQADVHPEDIEAVVLGITIHELAHILDRPALYRERRDAEPDRLKFEALVLADEVAQPRPTVAAPLYAGHGATFIRIALHLRHRAREQGVLLLADALCAGPRYGLSMATCYRAALGDEPNKLAHLSFREFAGIEPPTEFTNLWASDVAAHDQSSLWRNA
jgi:hypothetical protein